MSKPRCVYPSNPRLRHPTCGCSVCRAEFRRLRRIERAAKRWADRSKALPSLSLFDEEFLAALDAGKKVKP